MPMNSEEQVRFSISSSFENVAVLAEEVSNLCRTRNRHNSDAVDTLRLCIAEALNNIVEHAYDGTEGKPIYADVRFKPNSYEVMLIDEGKPLPGGQIPCGNVEFDADDMDELPEGGFGWMLIRSQMDAVEYERRDGCNVLRLEKNMEG